MSTFAVFGMTLDVATAEARKKTPTTRKSTVPFGGMEPIPEPEWLELVRKRTEKIMGGVRFASSRPCSTPRSTPSSSLRWPARP